VSVARSLVIGSIAFGSTLLASMSGGSSSMLTTPTWLALGFPLPTAVGADKIGATFWALVSSRNYLRGRALDRKLVAGMTVAGLFGAAIGTLVTTAVRPDVLRRAVGLLIVAVALTIGARPAFGREPRPPRLARGAAAAAAVPLGFYEGMLGSGNSIWSAILLTVGRGLDLPSALGHYYLMAGAWCALAAASYAMQGFFDPGLVAPVTVGAIAGGYLGSRIGSARGAGFLRIVMVIAALVLGGALAMGR
jgi:hypothetical protein